VLCILAGYRRNLYLPEAIDSIRRHVHGITRTVLVDDSGDEAFRQRFTAAYPAIRLVAVDDVNAGYQAAMQTVWRTAQESADDHILLFEEDFRVTHPINIDVWADHLDTHEYLAQIVAQRQPWFGNEIAAGGVLEALTGPREAVDGLVEHRLFFSGNPTVIPRRTFEQPWPAGNWSENRFRDRLLTNPAVKFAMTPTIVVEHVGTRTGHGY